MAFSDAENYCVNDGAHLISILSQDEELFFNNDVILTKNVWIGYYNPYGYNYVTNKTTWQWTDHSSVSYMNWYPALPGASGCNPAPAPWNVNYTCASYTGNGSQCNSGVISYEDVILQL
uniref:C-type lectin domain-containing protein n=1 Tax=Acrobeloides nanus TaxID=290746 RepID=A0A914BWH4_9BILA